jgi:hypothetical protein
MRPGARRGQGHAAPRRRLWGAARVEILTCTFEGRVIRGDLRRGAEAMSEVGARIARLDAAVARLGALLAAREAALRDAQAALARATAERDAEARLRAQAAAALDEAIAELKALASQEMGA